MSGKVVEVMTGVVRPTANFSPSIWGDHFLKYASTNHSSSKENEKENQIYAELKERVGEKLSPSNMITMTSSDKLNLIDVIQRLGVSYHFKNEIEQVLQSIYVDGPDMNNYYDNHNLYNCALCFRLLRQEGYNVSSDDMFKKFLDSKGEFNISIKDDIKGMLSLLDATHLRFRGEDVLEKAFNFTTKQFEIMLLHDHDLIDHINPHLAEQVTHSLKTSFLRELLRIEARNYFSFYENCNAHDKLLLKFAKLDFNLLQKMYQRELAELTRWWNNLNFRNKCPFARDRLVEGYFLALTGYFEPEYAYGREVLTKMTCFLSVLDDIYDAYGTWEELVLFTDAINRWEKTSLNKLPEYIIYYNDALHDYIEVLHNECVEREMICGAQYVKQMIKVNANAYMEEATWLHNKYIPTLEEYINVALISSGVQYLSVVSLNGMNPILATKEVFDWALENPPIIKAVAVIGRITDDIAGFKFEQERDHVVSCVQCYMNQYGVPENIAIFELKMQVMERWKDVNFELIQAPKFSKAILNHIVGLAMFMVVYRDKDGYTHPQLKAKDLTNLLVNPVDV